MLAQYQFQSAKKIVAGRHSIEMLASQLQEMGEVRSALILTQPSLIRLGHIDEMVQKLSKAGISSEVLTGVMNEPTVQNIEELGQKLATQDFDVYIAIGGGSVLDAAKILSVLRTNCVPVSELLGTNLVKKPGVRTVLIPTTSGTGSEVTPNAIVTVPEEELKVGIISLYLFPQLVIVDPILTLELPPAVTAATGMDAFTHSIESFISNKANPLSDMFALESMRKISAGIVQAYEHGSSVEARENMLLGSMYGGMALTCAGTAAVHALAYPLGGKFNIPHGVANSMLLPHVMEFNFDAISEKLAQLFPVLGLSASNSLSEVDAARRVIEQIVAWTTTLNIPQDLTAFGVSEDDVLDISKSAMNVTRLLNNNPKAVSIEDVQEIYRKLLP
ncbi:iron-containing alcohol dehydrogenase [Paenibacillus solisilvae]|uniref:Iron-containing alcohol dehydrogenase n=1 Tax=Paenibacillus solisilvae TaxID=2486751 RepID=A0ABW0W1B2_9BACL